MSIHTTSYVHVATSNGQEAVTYALQFELFIACKIIIYITYVAIHY